jgi:hypothetical protein
LLAFSILSEGKRRTAQAPVNPKKTSPTNPASPDEQLPLFFCHVLLCFGSAHVLLGIGMGMGNPKTHTKKGAYCASAPKNKEREREREGGGGVKSGVNPGKPKKNFPNKLSKSRCTVLSVFLPFFVCFNNSQCFLAWAIQKRTKKWRLLGPRTQNKFTHVPTSFLSFPPALFGSAFVIRCLGSGKCEIGILLWLMGRCSTRRMRRKLYYISRLKKERRF